MPELRKDPISDRWVIFSPARSRRPSEYSRSGEAPLPESSDFAQGNEDRTPPEIYAIRPDGSDANTPGWQLRVVPNKFPAIMRDNPAVTSASPLFQRRPAIGAHEVVIETGNSDSSLADLSTAELAQVLRCFRDRIRALKAEGRFQYVQVFKNHGQNAGATIRHSHSQIMAFPDIPEEISREMQSASAHFSREGRCIFCDLLEAENQQEERLIAQNDLFQALSPFAARVSCETWILPRTHHSHFEGHSDEDLHLLADLLRIALVKINRVLGFPPYNLILHSAPLRQAALPDYHWHIEIIPRTSYLAGLEWSCGYYQNALMPEEAARQLREAAL